MGNRYAAMQTLVCMAMQRIDVVLGFAQALDRSDEQGPGH
jgi:hypothetical protein